MAVDALRDSTSGSMGMATESAVHVCGSPGPSMPGRRAKLSGKVKVSKGAPFDERGMMGRSSGNSSMEGPCRSEARRVAPPEARKALGW